MDRLPGGSSIPANDGGDRFTARSRGRFLDGSGEAGSSRVMVRLGSVPCTPLVLTAGPICMIQRGKLFWRRAALLGGTALVIQIGTGHCVRDTVDVNVGG